MPRARVPRPLFVLPFLAVAPPALATPLLHWTLDDPATITEEVSGLSDVATPMDDVAAVDGLALDCADAVSFAGTPFGYIDAGTLQPDGAYVAGSAEDYVILDKQITIAVWVNYDAALPGTDQVIVSSDTGGDNSWWMFGTRTNRPFFDFGSGRRVFDIDLVDGETYFVSLRSDLAGGVFGDAGHRLSVWDGTDWTHESGSQTSSYRLQGLEIGSFNDGERPWRGTVDDVRIYGRALTDAQLEDLIQLRDLDQDGIGNACDVCPFVADANQDDADGDGLGDACDDLDGNDVDGDGVPNEDDVCPFVADANQDDADGDGLGDACDDLDGDDVDGDGVPNEDDLCPFVADANQDDADGDGLGDACDDLDGDDVDGDGVPNEDDVCPFVADANQDDADGDGLGDACDDLDGNDVDGDGVPNEDDVCPFVADADQADADADGLGDACDDLDGNDVDGDGVPNDGDSCPFAENTDQADVDEDGIGDACDPLDDRGCSSLGTAPHTLWLALLPLIGLRRRR